MPESLHRVNTLSRVATIASDFYHELDHQDVPEHVEIEQKPDLSWSNIKEYSVTRFSSLLEVHTANIRDINPFNDIGSLTANNWNYFFMGFFSWLSAAADFFCTAVAGTQIAAALGVSTSKITWGLSAVLMVRSAGAVIFGYWADNYSRKWPFIACVALFLALQIGTGFAKTYQQFLAIRAISGIAMGGTYGVGIATAIDDAPVKARSFLSGLFFSAYPIGFIMASIFWRAFEYTSHSWKTLFWFSSFLPAVLIAWRLCFPETKYFTKVLKARELIKQEQIEAGTYVKPSFKTKFTSTMTLCKKYWLMFIYLILLLAGANYLTHASQDLYPSMLRKQLEKSEDAIAVIITVINLGGVFGCLLVGALMEVTGRRLALLGCCVVGGAFTYPAYMLHNSSALMGAGFFLFGSVFGVWGVLPIHLSELSPPDARALVSGLAYQLGNLASSAASTIETRISDNYVLEYDAAGKAIRYNYSKTMAILTGAVFIYTIFFIFIGPEKFHRDLSSPVMKKYIAKVEEMEARGTEEQISLGETSEAKGVSDAIFEAKGTEEQISDISEQKSV